MQRPNKRPHDSDETHDPALVPYPTSSLSVARDDALSEATPTKQPKTDENPVVGRDLGHTFDRSVALSSSVARAEVLSELSSTQQRNTDENPRGPGHRYDRSIACDNARVQYGDTYNISYHRTTNSEIKDGGWAAALKALRFPQMNVRRQMVKDAHTGTCEWILGEPEYKSWCDTKQTPLHHGFLWIKSKPGAGKSTLMKFLLDSTEQRSAPHEAVVSFFFNARGESLEHSLEGMYRQLLHQLLTRVSRLQSKISALEISELEALGWSRSLLENSFKNCVLNLGQERVTCFIDALDECPESDIRDLIDFFEDLGDTTAMNGICFRICFSSRHYPNVTLAKCQHLMLDGQSGHQQDIAAYIDSKLRLSKSEASEEIKDDVQKRAQGVFLWVVLVVKRLNQDLDRGNIHNLRRRLEEVPGGLDALFRDTLRITGDNDGTMIQMMQWMMYARYTLTRELLYFGVRTSALSKDDPQPWDRDELTSEVLDRFIVNCSRGLIESTGGPRHRVQFIHESVRDFLFGGGLALIAPDISKDQEGASHDYLKRMCLKMYTKSMIIHVPSANCLLVSTDRQARIDASRNLRRLFPLLNYAWRNLLYHAEAASQHGVDQGEFVSSFPLQLWNQVRLLRELKTAGSKTDVFIIAAARNLLECELHPDYPLLAPVEHMHAIRNAVHSAESKDYETLKLVLRRGVVADISHHDQISLIDHTVRRQDSQLLKTLFDGGMRVSADYEFKPLLSRALLDRESALAQILLDHEAKFHLFSAGGAVQHAVNRGSIPRLEALLASGFEFRASAMQTTTTERIGSFLAAKQDYEVAQHLTAFQYAALVGRENVVSFLLEHAASQSPAPDMAYDCSRALYLAALLGHHSVVTQLLRAPSWGTGPGSALWQDALDAATINRHDETVKVLLADDAGDKARGSLAADYERIIEDTMFYGGRAEAMERLLDLLDGSLYFHAQGLETLGRVLVWATEHGYKGCVRILRERGVE
jgi:hypothetical protein